MDDELYAEDLWDRVFAPHHLYTSTRASPNSGQMTERKLTRMIRQGYGQGHLSAYTPWLRVAKKDCSPISNVGHLPAPTFGHIHHYRSRLERQALLIVQFAGAWDARDQYPVWPWPHLHPGTGLPGIGTEEVPGLCEIAKAAKIPIQTFVGGYLPIVATVDVLSTWRRADGSFYMVAHECKPRELLEGPDRWRSLERLALTGRYLNACGIEQQVIHAASGSERLLVNLDTLRPQLSRAKQTIVRRSARYRRYLDACQQRAYKTPVHAVTTEHAERHSIRRSTLQGFLNLAMWHQDLDHDLCWPLEPWLPLRPGGRDLQARLRRQWGGGEAV